MTSVAKWDSFGAKLRQFRETAGLTQKDLGEAVGMAPQAVARIESGSNPSWETAVKLAEALERSLDEFLDREG